MKTKKLGKKLALGKTTIVNLEQNEQGAVKGGYWATEFFGGCTTWHPEYTCLTLPAHMCNFDTRRECPILVSDEFCETEFC